MNQQARARLLWKIPTSGSVISPRGDRFVTPAKFDHQGDDWTVNAWSLVVESAGPVTPDGSQPVRVHFLMPDSPNDWLTPGRHFLLLEGDLQLAEGIVE